MGQHQSKFHGNEDIRRNARERVLTLMYEAESKGITLREAADTQIVALDELVELIVGGLSPIYAKCDALIAEHSRAWTLERMPMMDRNILRLGVFELLERPEIPVPVIIDEAIELAKRFSTDDSGRFVNGVLSAIAKEVRP